MAPNLKVTFIVHANYARSFILLSQSAQTFLFLAYLNDVHLVPSVVLRDNELLTNVPMDIDT